METMIQTLSQKIYLSFVIDYNRNVIGHYGKTPRPLYIGGLFPLPS